MIKELFFDLFGHTIHIYPASGASALCGVEVCDLKAKGTTFFYHLFFCLNFLGLGFAISDYSKKLKQAT
jgi:hypothetical protein